MARRGAKPTPEGGCPICAAEGEKEVHSGCPVGEQGEPHPQGTGCLLSWSLHLLRPPSQSPTDGSLNNRNVSPQFWRSEVQEPAGWLPPRQSGLCQFTSLGLQGCPSVFGLQMPRPQLCLLPVPLCPCVQIPPL